MKNLEDENIDLLVTLNGSPYEEGKRQQRIDLAAQRAAALGAPLVYANQVGGQDDLVFDGGSFVVGPSGAVLARAPKFEEHLLLWTLTDSPHEDHTGDVTEFTDLDEEVYTALVTGLQGYVRKNGFTSVVLGLSGGLTLPLLPRLLPMHSVARTCTGCPCRPTIPRNIPKTTPRTWPNGSVHTTGSSTSLPWLTPSKANSTSKGSRRKTSKQGFAA